MRMPIMHCVTCGGSGPDGPLIPWCRCGFFSKWDIVSEPEEPEEHGYVRYRLGLYERLT